MDYTFDQLEVGDSTKKALARAKITNPGHLIKKCATAQARRDISKITGLDADVLCGLALAADLLRIDKLGPGGARLLQATGVQSVKLLRRQSAETLMVELAETNAKARPAIVNRLPSRDTVELWIENAKTLQILVTT